MVGSANEVQITQYEINLESLAALNLLDLCWFILARGA